MADVMSAYYPESFQNIPDLHRATEKFTREGGTTFIEVVLKPLILKYKLEAVFGIGLLHRHFDLDATEKLVEFNNISTPWRHQQDDIHSGGKIMSNGWMIEGEQLMLYEFYFSPLGRDGAVEFTKLAPFVSEFCNSIKRAGFEDVLALRLFPHLGFEGGLEITEGRANINLTPDQVRKYFRKINFDLLRLNLEGAR
jgi:hypothetical protein